MQLRNLTFTDLCRYLNVAVPLYYWSLRAFEAAIYYPDVFVHKQLTAHPQLVLTHAVNFFLCHSLWCFITDILDKYWEMNFIEMKNSAFNDNWCLYRAGGRVVPTNCTPPIPVTYQELIYPAHGHICPHHLLPGLFRCALSSQSSSLNLRMPLAWSFCPVSSQGRATVAPASSSCP